MLRFLRGCFSGQQLDTLAIDGLATDRWLIVEDNDDDFFLLCRACRHAFGSQLTLDRAVDGLAGKEFLSAQTEPPGLIVSDLSMPEMDGLQFLKWVRSQEPFRQVRFVMLSNSGLRRDIENALASGANDYLVKPSDFEDLIKLVKRLGPGRTAV
jgi:CheY-like chemotaxis protein